MEPESEVYSRKSRTKTQSPPSNGTDGTSNGSSNRAVNEVVSQPEKTVRVIKLKEFEERDSLIRTVVRDSKDVAFFFNTIAGFTIGYFIVFLINYVTNTEYQRQVHEYYMWAFGDAFNCAQLTLLCHLIMFAMYMPIKMYVTTNIPIRLVQAIYTLWFLVLWIIPAYVMVHHVPLRFVLKFWFLAEQVRCLMKMHSFVAETTWMSTKEEKIKSGKELRFWQLVYFMYAPTLVFRRQYPMKKTRDWNQIITDMFKGAFLLFILFQMGHVCLGPWKEYGSFHQKPIGEVAMIYYKTFLFGSTLLLTTAYAQLDLWQNLFGEVLRFGDRQTYTGWWRLHEWNQLFKCWNGVVYDWTRTYLYRECIVNWGASPFKASLFTFFVSGWFHEHVSILTMGHFFPTQMISLVGFALFLWPLNRWRMPYSRVTHLGFNLGFYFGFGMLSGLYAAEFNARINCPRIHDGIMDYFAMRSFTCF